MTYKLLDIGMLIEKAVIVAEVDLDTPHEWINEYELCLQSNSAEGYVEIQYSNLKEKCVENCALFSCHKIRLYIR